MRATLAISRDPGASLAESDGVLPWPEMDAVTANVLGAVKRLRDAIERHRSESEELTPSSAVVWALHDYRIAAERFEHLARVYIDPLFERYDGPPRN
jgi:hypothetical protein